jgi:hypothetical protein
MVGLPVCSRALLAHEWGVPLTEIDWYPAGVNQASRVEHVESHLPAGIGLTRVPDRSLDEMLLDGGLDAVLSAHPPSSFINGDRGCPGCSPTRRWPRRRPYGVDANRTTLDAFTRWAYEQGVTRRPVAVAELFPAAVRSGYRI